MEYNYKLLKAEVEQVYNKLIVDAKTGDGKSVTAFCPAMEIAEVCKKGMKIWLKKTSLQDRLIKYNVAFVETSDGVVFANPKYNRQLFQEAFAKGILSDFDGYDKCNPLGAQDNAKGLDFELVAENGEKCFVFVTSIYDKIEGCAAFPHAINFFEMQMFSEMQRLKLSGHKVCVFMIAPRSDCVNAKFVWSLDAVAAAAIFEAAKNGVNFLCYGCKIEKNNIEINRKMDILY